MRWRPEETFHPFSRGDGIGGCDCVGLAGVALGGPFPVGTAGRTKEGGVRVRTAEAAIYACSLSGGSWSGAWTPGTECTHIAEGSRAEKSGGHASIGR